MSHILDRPIFTALATRHAPFAEGGNRAKRFRPAISPFACMIDDAPESLAELGSLGRSGDDLVFLQADPVVLPPGLEATRRDEGVQMLAHTVTTPDRDPRIVELGPADAADMLDLATLTRPGPFTLEAPRLGMFWGVRRGGRLVAMAGERLKQPGWTELSGVCTHPVARGSGLARALSLHVAAKILARGEQPYLHAFASNEAAIALYRSIGFHVRTSMHVAFATRTPELTG